ncbi:MAG TPA: FAD-linked oxidase C-terminal domain-containing protein [Flavobacteriaceae bacterium]|nr:FAD-linked oxidase C-terminal domain-containing protein [Flavobacteriaceae bacterium]
MKYSEITKKDLEFFHSILDSKHILTDEESLLECASDKTEDLVFKPAVVLQPNSTEDVSAILKHCNQRNLPIVPRGAGTGLSGGALPIHGGVVLDMQKMNRILNIDVKNFQVTTESGVITEELMIAVRKHGLLYPVDPASKGSCFIGGNIAENSGGARAVKYGVVQDQVLNLEIVLPNGEVMWTGANTLKNATGYNLTQLIVGSEGTLAVVTKIVLKLIKAPTEDLSVFVPFQSAKDACEAVHKIFMAGYTPSALEFMERDAIDIAQEYIGEKFIKLKEDINAALLIEVDGTDQEQLMQEIEGIFDVLQEFETGEILFADNSAHKESLWKVRSVMGEAAKSASIYKEEDTVVPRAELPKLIEKVKALGKEYGFHSVVYGHAGDGNLHINILKKDMSDDHWNNVLPKAIRELFVYTRSLGGTISGEHGIGYVQKPYMNTVFSNTSLGLQRQIKKVFDPNNILNPGKIFEYETDQ